MALAVKVESRVRPPDVTLMTDWPIIAQPPMPPTKAAAMLALPCPAHPGRLLLLLWVILGRRVRAPAAVFTCRVVDPLRKLCNLAQHEKASS
jgi:hypothetical protein